MSSPCIAVIDANLATLDRTALVLALDGYQSICFRTAADASAPIQQRRPELVIVDLHQERPDAGLEFVAALQSDPATAQIPILVWSADPQVGTTVARRQLTGVLVREKPVQPHDLLALVARLALVR